MGIQAHVDVLPLLKAGCTLDAIVERDSDMDMEWYSTIATFPNGSQYVFNGGGPNETSVWTDVNHWGNNRAIILPLLEQYGIPFVEG